MRPSIFFSYNNFVEKYIVKLLNNISAKPSYITIISEGPMSGTCVGDAMYESLELEPTMEKVSFKFFHFQIRSARRELYEKNWRLASPLGLLGTWKLANISH